MRRTYYVLLMLLTGAGCVTNVLSISKYGIVSALGAVLCVMGTACWIICLCRGRFCSKCDVEAQKIAVFCTNCGNVLPVLKERT